MDYLSNLLVRRRGWFAIGTIVVSVLLAFGLGGLGFDSSYRVFLNSDDPRLVTFDRLNEQFTSNQNIAFVVESPQGEIFSQPVLSMLESITKASWEIPFSQRVESIINYPKTEVEGDDFYTSNLVSDTTALTESKLRSIREKAMEETLLVNRLVNEEGTMSIIVVELIFQGQTQSDINAVVEKARDIRNTTEIPSGVNIYLAGSVMFDKAATEVSGQDAIHLLPLICLLATLITLIILRSFALMASTQIVIVASTLSGMGLAGWLQYQLNTASTMAVFLILILALADTIHVGATYLKCLQAGMKKTDAMTHSIEKNFGAVFLTSATTIIGLYSLNFLDSKAFADMGNIAINGIVLAFIYSLTLLPALLIAFTSEKPSTGISQHRLSAWISNVAINQRTPLFWFFLAIVLTFSPFIYKNYFNDNYFEYFTEKTDVRRAVSALERHMPMGNVIFYSFDSGSSHGINEPEFLQEVDGFVHWLKGQPEVTHVYSYIDLIKRQNQNMHAGDRDWYRLPDSRELASQYLLLYEMSLDFGQTTKDMISKDYSALKVSVRTRRLDNAELLAMEHRIAEWLSENLPNRKAIGTGPDILFAHQGKHVVESAQTGAVFTIILVTLALIAGLRSIKYGLISMIPNLVPALVVYGAWGMLVKEMNQAVAITYSVSLGIIVDDTVHILAKYLAEKRQGYSPRQAIANALENSATALIVTTLMIGVGMVIVSFASFQPNALIGIVMTPIIFIALIFDLFVLPGILIYIDERGSFLWRSNKPQSLALGPH